jgi:hypothetical protein
MYLPKQSRPAMRGGRRRPILASYPNLPGVFPLQEEDEDEEEAGADDAAGSDESAEAVEY